MDENITRLDELILSGAVEVNGIDDEGNFLYGLTKDASTVAPELWNQLEDAFYQDLLFLWTNGFIDMDLDKENPIINITKKAFEKDEVDKLTDKLKFTLKIVLMAMKK